MSVRESLQLSHLMFRLICAASLIATVIVIASPGQTQVVKAETVTTVFNYTGSTQTFTVPDGVSSISVTMYGGQGGIGGGDSQGSPTPGGYRGAVIGSIDVTPGQVITVAVGGGGGEGTSSEGRAPGGTAGLNPLTGYDGAVGGIAGPEGSSGGGGGGGGATVLRIGNSDIVAGGAGGNGGNGQFLPIVGRRAYDTHTPRSDTTSTNGRTGMNTSEACTPDFRCDGGASGAGGGGAVGGERGEIQYGGASATEYFGFGGYPGSNSTASYSNLSAYYDFYAGNSDDGSVTISYETGTPGAPTNVSAGQRNGSIALLWSAPLGSGSAPITDYVVYFATSRDGTYSTFSDGTSTNTTATVTGLTNGTTYFFKVAAVNSYGEGTKSAPMTDGVAPSDVPSAPTIGSISPRDGGLSVPFTAGASGATISAYEYQIDNGSWVRASGTTSPLIISGLTNGTTYSIKLRAISVIGNGTASSAENGTPASVPAAPAISAIALETGAVQVSFTAGANGGSSITKYQYSTDNGSTWQDRTDAGTTASPVTISALSEDGTTPLSGGSTYSVRLRAVNAAGTGVQSSASEVTVKGAPGAPTISAITASDKQLSVALTPGTNGGSPITKYQYSTDNGATWRDRASGTTGSPLTISALSTNGTTALENGTAYNIKIRAVNAAGAGTASSATSATPRTTADAPTIDATDTITGAGGTISVPFTTPASNGGAVITTYEYSTDAGVSWRTRTDSGTTGSPLVISKESSDGTTNLQGETRYRIQLRAVNAAGSGAASAFATGITTTAPSAPVITSTTGADGSGTVQFTAPANGGKAIIRYEYSLDSGDWVNTGTLATSFTIAGLTNGQSYSVRLRAVNSNGDSDPSTSATLVIASVPTAPTLGTVTAGDGSLSVAFTVPDSNGGSSITTYEYSTDGGATWRARASGSTGSPLVITRLSSDGTATLVNGATYAVQLRAVNAIGKGDASVSTLVVPRGVPEAVAIDSITVSDGSLVVNFTPGSDGGSAIIRYEYRLNGGLWTNTGNLTSPATIGGLTNGTSYTVNIRAVTDVGAGASSNSITATPAVAPNAPTNVTVTSGNTTATVRWSAPSNGGAAISEYTATAYNASTAGVSVKTCSIATTECTITELTNGTTYYVSVTATNSAGTSVESSPRQSVTPLHTPGASTITSISSFSGNLSVAFNAPASNGGSAIIDYEYQLNNGAWLSSGRTTSPISIGGLTNGVAYAVKIRAINAVGEGPSSDSVTKIPFGLPSVVGGITAAPGNNTVTVSWARARDNGSAISKYTAVAWNAATEGGISASCFTSSTTCTITGLGDTTTYYITVDAENEAGVGGRNNPRISVRTGSTPPSAPTISDVTAGDKQVTVAWTAGDAGTSPITDYVVQYSTDGTSFETFSDSVSTSTTTTVTGLINYQEYFFRVLAVSSHGAGSTSSASEAVQPAGIVPDAPTITVVTPGSQQVSLDWTAGAANSDPITDYIVEYSANSGEFVVFTDGVSVTSRVTVTGLFNGVSYRFRVAAVSRAGQSAYSQVSESVVPIVAPSNNSGSITSGVGDNTSPTTTVAPRPSRKSTKNNDTTTDDALDEDAIGDNETDSQNLDSQGSTAPEVPDVAPGEAIIEINGQQISAETTKSENNITVQGGGFTGSFTGPNPLNPEGVLVTGPGGTIDVGSTGFTENTNIAVFALSTPQQVATAVVGADGSYADLIVLPAGLEDGNHRLALIGTSPTGDVTKIVLGFVVESSTDDTDAELTTDETSSDNSSNTGTLVVVAILVAVVAALGGVAYTTRRRRR